MAARMRVTSLMAFQYKRPKRICHRIPELRGCHTEPLESETRKVKKCTSHIILIAMRLNSSALFPLPPLISPFFPVTSHRQTKAIAPSWWQMGRRSSGRYSRCPAARRRQMGPESLLEFDPAEFDQARAAILQRVQSAPSEDP